MNKEDYLQILEESLQQKIRVLEEIQEANREQEEILTKTPVDNEAFVESGHKKGDLIDRINLLDEGFEQLYQKVRDMLERHKEEYKEQIGRLKICIARITELSVSIQVQEKKNQELAQRQFAVLHKRTGKLKQSQKAMETYKASMKGLTVVDPQFMDDKK